MPGKVKTGVVYCLSALLLFCAFLILPYTLTNYVLNAFKNSFTVIIKQSVDSPSGKNNEALSNYFNSYLKWEKISPNQIVTPHKIFVLTFEGNGKSSCLVNETDKNCKMILEYNPENKFEYIIKPQRIVSNYKKIDILKVSMPFTLKLVKTRLRSYF